MTWDERYATAGEDYLFGTRPALFMERHAQYFQPGLALLSLADGEGRNSVWLAQRGLKVTALEPVALARERAARLAAARGVSLTQRHEDILEWSWPQAAYDIVLGVFIQFADARQQQRLFAGMQTAVRPGGLILLHGYTPQQLDYGTGGPSELENLYTEALLRDAFAGCELLELDSYEAELDEGRAHRGRSALIDLVARRPLATGAAVSAA
jgi:SAM-dependent methyltransferase